MSLQRARRHLSHNVDPPPPPPLIPLFLKEIAELLEISLAEHRRRLFNPRLSLKLRSALMSVEGQMFVFDPIYSEQVVAVNSKYTWVVENVP